MTVAEVQIRPLHTEDAERCDQIIASLPYHFGQEDGRRECADAVRSQPGLVAMLDHAVVGFLTVQRHFDQAAEITWMAVHARHRHQGVGRAHRAALPGPGRRGPPAAAGVDRLPVRPR